MPRRLPITDMAPPGYLLVSTLPSVGTIDPGSGVWNIGTLAARRYRNLNAVAQVLPNKAAGSYVNTASSNHPGDPVASNNSASATLRRRPSPI